MINLEGPLRVAATIAAVALLSSCGSLQRVADRQHRKHQYESALRRLPTNATRRDVYKVLPPRISLPAVPPGIQPLAIGTESIERYPLDADFHVAVPFLYHDAKAQDFWSWAISPASPKVVQRPTDEVFSTPTIERNGAPTCAKRYEQRIRSVQLGKTTRHELYKLFPPVGGRAKQRKMTGPRGTVLVEEYPICGGYLASVGYEAADRNVYCRPAQPYAGLGLAPYGAKSLLSLPEAYDIVTALKLTGPRADYERKVFNGIFTRVLPRTMEAQSIPR